MTLKKVRFLSKTGRFLSCYEIVKLKNSVFCIKKRYKVLKKARCTVDWRSIRDLNSGGATNALSHFECDPFDLLGNAPYSNPPKSSPEKGEKSRREQQIFNCRKQWIFDDGSLENQRQLPKCLLDFECRTFDLSDNSPYISSVILAPEECKKNTQERYEIVKSEPTQSPVRRTFSADETAGASKNFECSLLRPLE